MSSSLASTLNFISKQITIYIGIPIFILGILGGFLNIITFLSLRIFRESSCAFYLTVMSIVNIGQLLSGLFSRIMISGFTIDWTQTSLFYCKFRPFVLYITALICATCLCLATIDQYFATCTRPRWQQWSNIKLAHRLIIIFSTIWFLEQISSLVFYNQIISPVTNQTICLITNVSFAQFHTYFIVLILWFILPVIISVLFGILAYHNVQQIAHRTLPLVRRELDKQLTTMVLVQVLFNFVAAIPNLTIYLLSISENLPTSAVLISFANSISTCLFYVYFASPFYIYICVSERFRRQLIYVLFQTHLNRLQRRLAIVNQVAPAT